MTLFATAKDGIRLAFEIVGEGAPIVLVHGFASDRAQNWRNVGWYETLTGAGHRVVAMDCRGHGLSDKPHDEASYGDKMVDDIAAVMDAAGLERADVMGYSMGGILTVGLLMTRPERIARAICAGIGETYFSGLSHRRGIAAALRASDPGTITDPMQKAFRAFASQGGKDMLALAACMAADRTMYSREQLKTCSTPILVVDGDKDIQSGRPEPLAEAFTNGRAAVIPGRDHMTAVGDKLYKKAVLDFLLT
ncbi:MAG: alpha/beta hydrolase [Rhizomicrobium sp.]